MAEMEALRGTVDPIVEMSKAMDDLKIKNEIQAKTIASMHLTIDELQKMTRRVPLMNGYVAEVSKFHRETLIPLLQHIRPIVDNAKPTTPEHSKYIADLRNFLAVTEARAKHYDSSAFVKTVRQEAIDEDKRMTVKDLPTDVKPPK